ncbi:hypothetical protein [Caudoviricetes sp.]|nr:hypothetical protein [Caudoviricetes sp.]UOF81521.1 hypothetical protein [Caudoviricetes sp.]
MDEKCKTEVEYWSQQAMMWHEKYKAVLAQEEEHHRFKVALEKIYRFSSEHPKTRLKFIAEQALGYSPARLRGGIN